ncbi:MAG TPA: hypothetical protein VGD64_07950 [Acidisarcina sp.]
MKDSFFRRYLALSGGRQKAAQVPSPAREEPPVQSQAAPPNQPGPADHLRTGIHTAVSVAKNALKSSISLLVIVVFAVSIWALLLRFVSPKPLIVVDSFEVSSDIEKQAGFSGKNAADVFTDELNAAASAGERFKGNDYASPHHYGRIRNVFRIPVQTTYGIQFSGVSVDVIMDIYRRFRYDEWHISGDIVKAQADAAGKDSGKVDLRVRVKRSNSSENWELGSVAAAGVNAGVQTLARQMLSREQPELMGRANLQWALTSDHSPAGEAIAAEHFNEAVEDFRGWANNEPTNPLPYYYLSIAYHYWPQRGQQSYDLALWSQETLKDSTRWEKGRMQSFADWIASYWHGPAQAGDTEKYALGTEASAELEMASALMANSNDNGSRDNAATRKAALDDIQRAEDILNKLVSEGSPDADTEENLATAKAHRADIYANLFAAGGPAAATGDDLVRAYADDKAAIAIMNRIIREEPDSAGFHSNLATEYLNTGRVGTEMKARGMGLPNGETVEKWYRLAATEAEDSLHLHPHMAEGLSVAADALEAIEERSPALAESSDEERAHVCRAMDLIAPGSLSGVEQCSDFMEQITGQPAGVMEADQGNPAKSPAARKVARSAAVKK